MKQEEKKFIQESAKFMLLLIIVTCALFLLPGLLFFQAGEHLSIEKVVEIQSQDAEVLFGPAYSNEAMLYKFHYATTQPSEVLVVGTSRTMEFREHFFNVSFYNAGGGIGSINEFKYFLSGMRNNKQSTILIIGLDQNFFNEAWTPDTSIEYTERLEAKKVINIFRDNTFNIYVDYFSGKIDYTLVKENEKHIGFNAIMNKNGFRNDGSYAYGQATSTGGVNNISNEDYNFTDTLAKIAKGEKRFVYGNEISDYAIQELDTLLHYTNSKNIHVIAFLPPYATEVWDKLEEEKENYQYLYKINSHVKPLFDKYNYSYFDFSSMEDLGASPCEVIDGLHASEKTYLRMIINMAKNDATLQEKVDVVYLENLLEQSSTCFSTN